MSQGEKQYCLFIDQMERLNPTTNLVVEKHNFHADHVCISSVGNKRIITLIVQERTLVINYLDAKCNIRNKPVYNVAEVAVMATNFLTGKAGELK